MQKISLVFVMLIMAGLTGRGQETKMISLKQLPMHAVLSHYHVAGVKDDRSDTSNIGSVRAGLFSKKSTWLNLPGGPAAAIGALLSARLKQDSGARAIVLHILQLEVGEKTGGLKAESEVRMTIGFYAAGVKLIEYSSANTVQATLDAKKYIEELIRQGLDDMLQQFDGWCAAHPTENSTNHL